MKPVEVLLFTIAACLAFVVLMAIEPPKPKPHYIYWCSGALTDGRQIFYIGAPCKDWPSEPVDV